MSLAVFDATTGVTISAPGSPYIFSHTVTAGGVNRCLYVVWTGWAATAGDYPSACNYGGNAMTKVLDNGGVSDRVIIFRLINPPTGANNVSVSNSGNLGNNGVGHIQALSLTNVDQTTPERNAGVTATGNSVSPSVTLTSDPNDMGIDGLATDDSGTPTVTMVAHSGRTQLGNTAINGERGASSRAESPTTSTAMDWTRSAAGTWAVGAVSVQGIASGTLEQESYRFRNDDGTEATATWLVAQDTNVTQVLATNTRLRLIINYTGTVASRQYRLEYKRTGGNWRQINP